MSFTSDHELISFAILLLSCGLLLAGYNLRSKGCGPWIMLLGICTALAIIAYNILKHTGYFMLG